MNDEELGHALGTALVPPPVQPVADAGIRLRARARRRRRDHLLAAGSLVTVLGVLLAVAVVRTGGGGAPATPVAGPATGSYGFSRLRVPLTVAAGALRFSTDEVAAIKVTPLLESGVIVAVTLTATDTQTLTGLLGLGPDGRILAGAGESFPADRTGAELRIRVPTPRLATELVTTLAPYRPVARTGPGRLGIPLQLWTVTDAAAGPCPSTPPVRGTLVTDRAGACLTLRGPGVSIGTAELRLQPDPGTGGPAWIVAVYPSAADAAALAAYTGGHVGDRVAFVAGGRLVGPVPELEGPFSAGLQIAVTDRDEATALVSRLRP